MYHWRVVGALLVIATSGIGALDLYITADNIIDEMYFDGVAVDSFYPDSCDTDRYHPCIIPLTPRPETIAIKFTNPRNRGGVIASSSDGSLVTDGSWKCSETFESGWERTDFDDSAWQQCSRDEKKGQKPRHDWKFNTQDFNANSWWISKDKMAVGTFYLRKAGIPKTPDQVGQAAAVVAQVEPTVKITTENTPPPTVATTPESASEVSGEYNLADLDIIFERLFDRMMPSPSVSCYKDVPYLLLKMHPDGYFTNLNYKNNKKSNLFRNHGRNLATLAIAYHCDIQGNLFYQSNELKQKIIKGFEYFAGDCPDNKDTSWWNQMVEVPRDINRALILFKNELPNNIVIAILDRWVAGKRTWNNNDKMATFSGANWAYRATQGIYEGVLRGPSFFVGRFTEFLEGVGRELIAMQSYNEEGIQQDYCIHQHNFYASRHSMVRHTLYNGVYIGTLTELPPLLNLFRGTSFEVEHIAYENLVKAFCDCHQWLIWNTAVEPTSTGRKIEYTGLVPYSRGPQMLIMANSMIVWGYRVSEIEKAIRRYGQETPAPEDALVGNRDLFSSAMMVHRRICYMMSVRMISERVYRPEVWSDTNPDSYYEGDGFTVIVQTGYEWGESGKEVFKDYDWSHIPGATIEGIPIPQVPTARKFTDDAVNQESFVGGVSDMEYGASAMIYNRKTVRVYAKKAWFYLEDEMIALGCDIKGKTPLEEDVHTTVNQVQLVGSIKVKKSTGQIRTFEKDEYSTNSKPQWVLQDEILYVPLSDAKRFTVKGKETSETDVFMFYINHGKPNKPAHYAYVVRPCIKTEAEADEYVNQLSTDVTISRNDPDAQVVTSTSLQMTQAIIYTAGTAINVVEGLEVTTSDHCMLLFRVMQIGGSKTLEISASRPANPTTPTGNIDITVKGNLKLTGSDVTGNDAGQKTTTISREVLGGTYAGKSETKVYTLSEW